MAKKMKAKPKISTLKGAVSTAKAGDVPAKKSYGATKMMKSGKC